MFAHTDAQLFIIPEGTRSWQRLGFGSSDEGSTVTQFLYSLDVTPRAYYLFFNTSSLLLSLCFPSSSFPCAACFCVCVCVCRAISQGHKIPASWFMSSGSYAGAARYFLSNCASVGMSGFQYKFEYQDVSYKAPHVGGDLGRSSSDVLGSVRWYSLFSLGFLSLSRSLSLLLCFLTPTTFLLSATAGSWLFRRQADAFWRHLCLSNESGHFHGIGVSLLHHSLSSLFLLLFLFCFCGCSRPLTSLAKALGPTGFYDALETSDGYFLVADLEGVSSLAVAGQLQTFGQMQVSCAQLHASLAGSFSLTSRISSAGGFIADLLPGGSRGLCHHH